MNLKDIDGITLNPPSPREQAYGDGSCLTIDEIRNDIFQFDKNGNKTGLDVRKTAIMLKAHYRFFTIGERISIVYRYCDGVYLPDGELFIKAKIQEWTSGLFLTNSKVSEVIGQIQRSTQIDRTEINKDPEIICLKNGIFNLRTKELKPHNPDELLTIKIKVSYNPEAKCPKILKFLSEILKSEDITIIQEFIGFCLYQRYFLKKALILVGETDSGKTTFLKLLIKLIGIENCSGESLHRIIIDKFSAINLYDKLTNYFDDLSLKDLNDTGNFKIVCGGGFISGEKKFGDRFQFINFAKLIFATNKVIGIKDADDDAYYSRWLIIIFQRDEESINNPHLIDELTTQEELEGLFIWSLEGLDRLLTNNSFSDTKTPEEIKNLMERYGDSTSLFCQEVVFREDGKWISKDELYNIYSNFTQIKKVSRVSKEKLGRDISNKLNYVLVSQKEYNNKKGVPGWLNLGINNTFNINNSIIIHTPSLIDVIYNKGFKVLNDNTFNTNSLTNTEIYTPLPFELVSFGTCSLCGNEKSLTCKDSKGNFVCSDCGGID